MTKCESYLFLGYYMVGNDPIEGTMCDVAHVTWGSEWYMPSYEQLQELYNTCTHEREVLNQVVGYRFTGSNGGSIFLPAAGCYLGSKCYEFDEGYHYWSGTPYYECGDCEVDYTQANCLTVIDGGYIDVLFTYRSVGLSVRPVITKDAPLE